MIDLNDVLERQLTSGKGEAGADQAKRKANEEILAASKEGVMVGEVQTIVFAADQIYWGALIGGADGTRTRDLRRDRPEG
jgi:hypothetical protein